MEPVCGVCSVPSEQPLCWTCLGRLRGIIVGLKWAAKELQVQVTKQSVGAPSVGSHEGHIWKLPFDLASSDIADEVYSVLARWSHL